VTSAARAGEPQLIRINAGELGSGRPDGNLILFFIDTRTMNRRKHRQSQNHFA